MTESQKKDNTIADIFAGSLFDSDRIKSETSKEMEAYRKFAEELKQANEHGEDISEYVWPYEWDLRIRPEPHHAGNIISLADAIDLSGASIHGPEWQAEDWYARRLEDIERWNPGQNTYRAYNFTRDKKGADFTNRSEEEKRAYVRKKEVYGKLSGWLNQGLIESFTLDDEGTKGRISSNVWLSRDALEILDSGKISEKEGGNYKIGGKSAFVYLDKEQLSGVLATKKAPFKIKQREEYKPKEVICPEGIWSLEAAVSFSEKNYGEECGSRKMGDVIRDFLHFLLTTPALEVFTVNSYDGHTVPIDRNYLKSKSAAREFLKGFIPFYNEIHSSNEDGEFIFLNRTQFENYLTDRPIVENPEPDESRDGTAPYVPAYLEFMLKAAKALNLSADKRENMDRITRWIDENWPSDLEGKSDRLIQVMATLLRRPQDKKGGNTRWSDE